MRRWIAIAGLLGACGGDDVTGGPSSNVVEAATFPAMPGRDLDVLFLVDDSTGADIEVNVRNAMAAFTGALATVPGGLPNLHVGVATSDMGTTGSLAPDQPGPAIGQVGNGGCAGKGKDGLLQLGMAAADVTGAFVSDLDDGAGGRSRNYTGALADVVGRMILLGSGGCGFEQDLAGMRRALTNPVNAGFRRPAASLAVIFIGDEDDCSVRDRALFGPESATLGPLASFRCARFGVVCAEGLDGAGVKSGCVPREDSPYVDGIAPFIEALDQLEPDRAKLVVAGLLGPPRPFEVELRGPPGGGTPVPAVAHACTYQSASGPIVADPALRLASFIAHHGSLGAFTEVCHTDLRPQLTEIARTTKQLLGVACLDTSKLADSRDLPGVQPACEVHDVRAGAAAVIPACPSDGDCYQLVPDAAACPETADHLRVAVTRVQSPPADSHIDVFCEGLP